MFGKSGIARLWLGILLVLTIAALPLRVYGVELGEQSEDERAMSLLKKGRLLREAKKEKEAVELWQSTINRFPRSKVRFALRLELGKYYLDQKDTEKAIGFLHRVIEDTVKNEDEDQVAEAMFLIGKAYFEAGSYGRAFTSLRKVTSLFPGTRWCNEAYYYIGMGHFRLKNYKRAIEAFQMVGTSITENDVASTKIEGGRRLYLKVSDDDLLRSLGYENIQIVATSGCGDSETVQLLPVGMKGRVFVGSVPTELGNPVKDDGKLQTWGKDTIKVNYVDKQAADKKYDVPRMHDILVCGTAKLGFYDGALRKPVTGVALDSVGNIHVIDSDRDATNEADAVSVVLRIKQKVDELERPKTIEEIEKQQELGAEQHQYKTIQEIKLDLKEYDPEYMRKLLEGKLTEGQEAAKLPDPPTVVHSGRFLGHVAFLKKPQSEEDKEALAKLENLKKNFEQDGIPFVVCEEGQIAEIEYTDELSVKTDKPLTGTAQAALFPPTLNAINVFDRQIKDKDQKIRTELKTAEAVLELGRIYKDLGLLLRANEKFDSALENCKEVLRDKVNDRELLEQTQVMLWKIYFAKGDLDAAARMCWQLLNSFGDDADYADEALLQLGMVAEEKKDYQRAVGVYKRLLTLKTPYQAESQFKIAQCYEKMAQPKRANEKASRSAYEHALVEYKKVSDKFPNSKFAAEATMKIAEFYYKMRDYARACEIYERALEEYPDSAVRDYLLMNYGKSLLLMRRYPDALRRFNQILSDHPESKYVGIVRRYINLTENRMAQEGGEE